jgi:hypothetical protein
MLRKLRKTSDLGQVSNCSCLGGLEAVTIRTAKGIDLWVPFI